MHEEPNCPAGDDCRFTCKVNMAQLSPEVIVLTYIGEYAVLTSEHTAALKAPPFTYNGPKFTTSVVWVGDRPIAYYHQLTLSEWLNYVQFHQEHNELMDSHDFICAAVRSEFLTLGRPSVTPEV